MVRIWTLFLEAYILREVITIHGETTSDRAYKDAIICATANSFSDVKIEQIASAR